MELVDKTKKSSFKSSKDAAAIFTSCRNHAKIDRQLRQFFLSVHYLSLPFLEKIHCLDSNIQIMVRGKSTIHNSRMAVVTTSLRIPLLDLIGVSSIHQFLRNLCRKRNAIWTIGFIVPIICLSGVRYFCLLSTSASQNLCRSTFSSAT